MLVMRTTEHPAYPLGQLVCSKQSVGFYDLALCVDPLGLYGVKPRTLLGKKATDDPHSAAAPLDLAVVPSEPPPHLPGDVPAGVVPDEEQNLLADLFKLVQAPLKKPRRYGTDRPSVHESQPRLINLRQVETVTRDGFRLGVVFSDRPLNEAQGLVLPGPTVQGGQSRPAPPALITEAHRPPEILGSNAHQPVAPSFFLSYRGSGEVIHRFARIHRTPRRRESVARTVSPETRLLTSPCSKATSAAISSVQRLESLPNSLGERWSISRNASALLSSKASRVRFGREDFAMRASRPFSLKSWMASRTVCWPHPRFSAIFGTSSPLELATSICDRRKVKAYFERSPAWRHSRSLSDNERTKIGISMKMSSRRWSFERGPVAQHRPQDVDPPPRQRDEGLGMPLTLSPFAIVESSGGRGATQTGERRLVESSFEDFIATSHPTVIAGAFAGVMSGGNQPGAGSELVGALKGREVPHTNQKLGSEGQTPARQASDDLSLGAGEKTFSQFFVERLNALFEGEYLFGQLGDDGGGDIFGGQADALGVGSGEGFLSEAVGPLDATVSEIGSDPFAASTADRCRSLVVGKQGEGTTSVKVQCSLQSRKQRKERLSEAGYAAIFVGYEVA